MTQVFNNRIPGMIGQNALPYVEKHSNLCPYCKNAQTNVQSLKNISEKFNEKYVKIVWNCIISNNFKLFTKKELMEKMDILHISNGVKQDEALSILIILGYLRKEIQIFINDKKRKKKGIYIF